MKHLYVVRSAGLCKIFHVISVTILWFYLFSLTHLLNGRQVLTYYSTLILNVFAMMPKEHYC